MNPLVSVIIPVFNSVLYIEDCIKSAKSQTYKNIEIIVIDDGSDILTKNKIKDINHLIDFIITQENYGPSKARNVGIKKAKGEYILILDSDDYFKPTFLEKAVPILDKNPDTKFVSCYLNRFEGEKVGPLLKMMGGTLKDYLYRNATIGNGLFRKNEIDKVGGYDEKMRDGYVDWELIIRILKDGGNTSVIPEPLFMYRSSLKFITNRAKKKRAEILAYIFKKHRALYQENFTSLIDFYTKEQELLNSRQEAILESRDYKIGRQILKPIRILKGIFLK